MIGLLPPKRCQFYQIRFQKRYLGAFFCGAVDVHGSDSYPPAPIRGYCRSIRERTAGNAPGVKLCGLGQTMSGVIVAMRRTLLSCTSLARNGLIGLGTAALMSIAPAHAGDLPFQHAISASLDLNRQAIAVLATALALLGFSVVAAGLLMRARVRATRNEARLRSDIGDLQVQADRLRALLFAEPQILISWAAGDDRPQISGDTSLRMPQESQQHRPQRILAFGTWLPPEPALQIDHAVDALRDAGEGFLLNLTTPDGSVIEAI